MDNIFKNQLLLINGVSEQTATCIVEKYSNVRDLLKAYDIYKETRADRPLLADIIVGKRKIDLSKTDEEICKLFDVPYGIYSEEDMY